MLGIFFPGWCTPSPPCFGYFSITFELHVEKFLSTNRRNVLDFLWDPNQSGGESPQQAAEQINKRHGYAYSMLPRMPAVVQVHVGSSRSVHHPLPYFIFVDFNSFALSNVVFVCWFIPVLVLARRFCWLRLARPRVDVTVLILAFRLCFRGGIIVDTCYVAYVVGLFFASCSNISPILQSILVCCCGCGCAPRHGVCNVFCVDNVKSGSRAARRQPIPQMIQKGPNPTAWAVHDGVAVVAVSGPARVHVVETFVRTPFLCRCFASFAFVWLKFFYLICVVCRVL